MWLCVALGGSGGAGLLVARAKSLELVGQSKGSKMALGSTVLL